jgi:hypothetical protein
MEAGMNRRQYALWLVTFAALGPPAWGQTPVTMPAKGTARSTASIPDFSGVWAHPSWPSFDPPLSGPGPIVNRSRTPNGTGNTRQFVGDYTNPILKPGAADVVKKHGEISLAGIAYPTPANQCWPQPLPYIFWNIGMQMLQQPDEVTILYFFDHEVRHVRLNAQHPANVMPSWYGDSVGHYEGDTLVVDTVGIKAARPFAMVDVYGTPYTDALHVVERYRLIDFEAAKSAQELGQKENPRILVNDSGLTVDPSYRGKGLQLEFKVEDDNVFTMPWSATMTYLRALGDWPEYVCNENTSVYYSGRDNRVPHADKPDF